MFAEPLINVLTKLLILHKSLNKLAKQKTEIIKVGDMESLGSIVKEELKYIQAIKQLDREREKIINQSFGPEHNSSRVPFDEAVGQIAGAQFKAKLIQIKVDLSEQLTQLIYQNELNQQLIMQSLQFVKVSLDLLLPDTEAIDYTLDGEKDYEFTRVSTFDFKA